MNTPRSQRGQMLIGVVLAIGLLTVAMASIFHMWRNYQVQQRANAYGQTLAQFAVGLRGYVAAVQAGTYTPPSNPYTVVGVDWLKPNTCGGLAANPPEGFIPCAFDGGRLGKQYSTTIVSVGANIEGRTSVFVPKDLVGPKGAGSLAAATAESALAQQVLAANGMFYNVFANSAPTAIAPVAVNAISTANRGRVLLVVNNAPSNDIWLRTDGTNMMLADLNAGGQSIVNAKDGTFSGTLSVGGAANIGGPASLTKTLAVAGATTLASSLTVNGATTLKGSATVNGATTLKGGATVTGDVTVLGNGEVEAKDFRMSGLGLYASQAFYHVQTLTGATAYNVAKPNCSAYGNAPQIYAALQGTGSAASSYDALYEGRVNVTNYSTYWRVNPIVRVASFSVVKGGSGSNFTVTLKKDVVQAAATDQQVVVWTRCG